MTTETPETLDEATAAVAAANATILRITEELITLHDPADAMLVITGIATNLICLSAKNGKEIAVARLLFADICEAIPERKAHYDSI